MIYRSILGVNLPLYPSLFSSRVELLSWVSSHRSETTRDLEQLLAPVMYLTCSGVDSECGEDTGRVYYYSSYPTVIQNHATLTCVRLHVLVGIESVVQIKLTSNDVKNQETPRHTQCVRSNSSFYKNVNVRFKQTASPICNASWYRSLHEVTLQQNIYGFLLQREHSTFPSFNISGSQEDQISYNNSKMITQTNNQALKQISSKGNSKLQNT